MGCPASVGRRGVGALRRPASPMGCFSPAHLVRPSTPGWVGGSTRSGPRLDRRRLSAPPVNGSPPRPAPTHAARPSPGQPIDPRPAVDVMVAWDLDNCHPGRDPFKAAVVAHRLMAAATQLGGGGGGDDGLDGIDGDVSGGGARVVTCRAFGNAATLARVDTSALAAAGVAVVEAGEGPDAADMAMGAYVMAFAHAGAMRRYQRDGVDAPPPPPPLFVTPRALKIAAAEPKSADDDDRVLREASEARAAEARASVMVERSLDGGRGSDAFFSDAGAGTVVMLVTTDNDLLPCMEYAAALGCGVVVCGDLVPGVHRRRKTEARTKRVRRSIASDPGVGVTGEYWAGLQAAAQARPVGRLRLLRAAHAALVWDSARRFVVTPEEGAAAAAAAAAASGGDASESSGGMSTTQTGSRAVAGGVVGVWRRHGRGKGVGRWPSPHPVVASLE